MLKMKETWKVEWDDRAVKELRKLDKTIQKKILAFLRERIATTENPKRFGKGLQYEKHGLWRYRVEDYRVICRITDAEITVLVIQVSHRKNAY